MQLRKPWVVIGSDAGGFDPDSARGLVHPRSYGTFARVLGKYSRTDSLFTLEEAVRKYDDDRAKEVLRVIAETKIAQPVSIRHAPPPESEAGNARK